MVTAQLYRGGVRKAKSLMELNLARDAKNNKKGFYRYVEKERKRNPEKEGQIKQTPLTRNNGKPVATDKEKAEVLHNSLPQSSLATSFPTPLQWTDHKTWIGGAKSLPL